MRKKVRHSRWELADEFVVYMSSSEEIWDQVRDGSRSVTDVCLSCGVTENVTHCHPFFLGGHCTTCKVTKFNNENFIVINFLFSFKNDFVESLFLYGSDGISVSQSQMDDHRIITPFLRCIAQCAPMLAPCSFAARNPVTGNKIK